MDVDDVSGPYPDCPDGFSENVEGFFDPVSGGFFDTEQAVDPSVKKLGVLDAQQAFSRFPYAGW